MWLPAAAYRAPRDPPATHPRPAPDRGAPMSVLSDLTDALDPGRVEIVDLPARLTAETPVIALPPEFGQTHRFELEEISRYDERGPAWYWNNFRTGEHTGTHFDAPNHWVTGRDGHDISSVPVSRLIGPAAVLDVADRVAENPDHLVEVEDIRAWESQHGPLPDGGWLLVRTGWESRSTQQYAINADETGPHSPGLSAEAARWVAEESPLLGMGVETVGTDA